MLRRRLYAVRKPHWAGLIRMRPWLWLLVERPNGRHLAPPRVSDAGLQLGIGIAATVGIFAFIYYIISFPSSHSQKLQRLKRGARENGWRPTSI